MRLPERYKQTLFIQNETFLGSDVWLEPYKLRGIVTPTNDMLERGGVSVQGNTDDIKFESGLPGAEIINQNSRIWIRREPDENVDNTNYTHTVLGRSPTTNGWFITIHCKSSSVDVPIV